MAELHIERKPRIALFVLIALLSLLAGGAAWFYQTELSAITSTHATRR